MKLLRKRKNKKIPRGSAVNNSAWFRGFTLIEMVIYVGLCSIILGSLAFFASWALQAGAKAKMERDVLNNGQRALEIMVSEIKKSKNVYDPTSVFNSYPGQLSLEQATAFLPQESETFVDFFQCGQSLCLKRENDSPIALTDGNVALTDLKFFKISNNATSSSIQINLGLESSRSVWGQSQTKSKIWLQTSANLNAY